MTPEKIIGACLADPKAAAYVVENAGEGLFNHLTLATFQTIKRLYAAGEALTFETIVGNAGVLTEVALRWLADSDPGSVAIDLDELRKLAFMSIFRGGVKMVEDSYSTGHDVASAYHVMAAKVQSEIADIEQERSATMAELIQKGHGRSLTNKENKVSIIGLPTKWSKFNRMTEGFIPGLHLIGARPSTGKTTFSGELIRDQATRGVKGGFLSLEMAIQRIADKVAGNALGVNDLYLVKGIVPDHTLEDYLMLAASKWTSNIEFIEPKRSNLDSVKTSIYKLVGLGCKYIVGDHIHRVYIDSFKGSSEQMFSVIGRELSSLAYDLRIPIIFLAQVNRGVDSRPDKRPLMADLKYASTLEEVCETVSMLYRPSAHQIHEDENGIPYPEGYMELIIRKVRDLGVVGAIEMIFQKGEIIEMEDYLLRQYPAVGDQQLPDVPF